MAKAGEFIGFPPGMLGQRAYRLPLLRNHENWFALYKPPQILARSHPWHGGTPDLTLGIKTQLNRGKPEFERLGIKSIYFIFSPEYEVGGPAIFAKNKETSDLWRNAIGSNQCAFSFMGLSTGSWSRKKRLCNLPVARHQRENRVVISHKTGKKSRTHFENLGERKPWLLWRARARNPRPHQIRIHAAESGWPILGDEIYGSSREAPDAVIPHWSRRGSSRFRGLAMFLKEARIPPQLSEQNPIVADLPRAFAGLLRKTGLAGG